jgi:hypothetical protein
LKTKDVLEEKIKRWLSGTACARPWVCSSVCVCVCVCVYVCVYIYTFIQRISEKALLPILLCGQTSCTSCFYRFLTVRP